MHRQRKYQDEAINEAINELTAYNFQKEHIAELLDKRAEYAERYTAIQAVCYDGIRVNTGRVSDSLQEAAIKWADMDIVINRKIQQAENMLWKVKDKLSKLPPLQAQVLELYYIKKRSINKIGIMMSYSAEWVKSAKYEGLKKYSEFPKINP